MLASLSRNWWAFALQGVAAVIFGIVALAWPGLTLLTLVFLFGAWVMVDGVFSVIEGLANPRGRDWWVVLRGVAGIVVGLVTLFWPGVTALVLLYFIASWAIITGVLEIVAGIQWRRMIRNEWMMILVGVLSILFGVVLAIFPGAGALSLVWLIGIYAIVFGVLFIILGLRLRGLRERETGEESRV